MNTENMRFRAILRAGMALVLCMLLNAHSCRADEPTAAELCRQRNTASCEINGLKFFIEDDCPRGAKTLRPKGTERCDLLAPGARTVDKIQPVQINLPAASRPQAGAPAQQDNASSFWGNPFIVLAVIGLVQGLISSAGVGALLVVALVMPAIATWAIMAGAPAQVAGYWGQVGITLLQTVLCSMAGWGLGVALRTTLFKIPFK